MPLLDHFIQLADDPRANWESFHHRWANAIADHLDQILPQRFCASVEIHLGSEVVADVGEFEPLPDHLPDVTSNGAALQTIAPPVTAMVMPGVEDDETEIQIRESRPRARLLGVIELVSPSNKHGPEERTNFVAKCGCLSSTRCWRRRSGCGLDTSFQSSQRTDSIPKFGRIVLAAE